LICVWKNLSIYNFSIAKNFKILDFEDAVVVVGTLSCLMYFRNKLLLFKNLHLQLIMYQIAEL